MNFEALPVRTRLLSAFGIIVVLLISVALTGFQSMRRSNNDIHQIVDINVEKILLLNEMSSSVHIVSRVIRSIALLHEDGETSSQAPKIVEARKKYDEAEAALEKMPLDDKGKEFVEKIKSAAVEARSFNNKFLSLTKTDQEAAVRLLMTDGLPSNALWQSLLADYTALQMAKNKTFEASTEASYHASSLFMLIFTTLAVLFAGIISWYISRSVVRQIGCEPKDAIDIAHRITDGDLTVQIDVRPGDQSSLFYSIKLMRDSLSNMVAQVRLASDSIAANSSDIVQGNMDLSSRTEHQASALEQTASSMEELTSTVRQNADNSQQAKRLSNSASSIAVRGGEVVNEVIATMNSINASSRKIVDIISVIDGIAFQTNILALNAAVEAARAGEQGRGFAVVATEVRNLAQRSASAAKEVKALIDDSVEQVTQGSKLVDQAGVTITEVVTSVGHVTAIIGEIAAASDEQTAGIEQINQAIISMDNVTQQNAALVEEAAAASSSLQSQVNNLVGLISVFKVDQKSPVRATEPAPTPVKTVTRVSQPSAKKVVAVKSAPAKVLPAAKSSRPAHHDTTDHGADWEEF